MIWMHFLVYRRVEANFAREIKRDRHRSASHAPKQSNHNIAIMDNLSNAQADTIWSSGIWRIRQVRVQFGQTMSP